MACDQTGDQEISSVRVVRSALAGILVDDSFSIPTAEIKKCLEMAQTLIIVFGCDQASSKSKCEAFSSWLVDELKEIIIKATKRNGAISAEQLWSRYHEFTISQNLKKCWEEFLDSSNVEKEPMFYQHITDEVFDKLITHTANMNSSNANVSEQSEEQDLTYEEENAIYYVGGYVIHSLMQQRGSRNFQNILEEFINKDDVDQENVADEWLKTVDQGGLTRITTDTFQLFYAIETCTRRHLKLVNAVQMDDSFRRHLTNCVLNDENVLFYWCMAGQDEGDENAQKCLEKMVEKWITIRGYSFASSIMEMYKQEQKKGTAKSKSLRSKLF